MKQAGRSRLSRISVDELDRNPENPRLLFDQAKLDLLAESIAKVGVLVPLLVYKDDDGMYKILDGERRWRCAKQLNLKDVPANIIAKPTKLENILTMFNIHNVREEWELMATALKFEELMGELRKQGITSEKKISELTSLKVGTIRRCKILISLPKRYQDAILKRELKADFFIEMDAKVLRPIEENLPELYEKYGREGLIEAFVQLLRNGKIKSVTDFRYFQKVVEGSKFGIDADTVESLSKAVIVRQEMTLKESYEAIEDAVNITKVAEKSERLSQTFRTLSPEGLRERLGKDETKRFRSILLGLRKSIDLILERL